MDFDDMICHTVKLFEQFPDVLDHYQNGNVVDNFKIRASYGVIGNQDIDPYSTLASLKTLSFN